MGIKEQTAQYTDALYISLETFPPAPKRLLDHLEVLSRIGYTILFVEWGDLFPWALDERFSAPYAYSQEVVFAISERCKKLNIKLSPVFPVIGGMHPFLSVQSYTHLRDREDTVDILGPDRPGAGKFLEDLMDDMLGLIPDPSMILIPDCGIDRLDKPTEPAGYVNHIGPLVAVMRSRGIRPVFRLTVPHAWDANSLGWAKENGDIVVSPEVRAELSRRRLDPVYSLPSDSAIGVTWVERGVENGGAGGSDDDFGSHPVMRIVNGHGNRTGEFKASLETCLDLIERNGSGKTDFACRLDESRAARESISVFTCAVSRIWNEIRHLREMLYEMTVDSQYRAKYLMQCRRTIADQNEELTVCERKGRGVFELLRSRIEERWLNRWIRARIMPLKEELTVLETRMLQLEYY